MFAHPRKYSFVNLQDRLLHNRKPEEAEQYERVPFDLYCPSMNGKLDRGIFPTCYHYWPSEAAMKRHKVCHGGSIPITTSTASHDSETEGAGLKNNTAVPVFENIFDILKSPFVECEFGEEEECE